MSSTVDTRSDYGLLTTVYGLIRHPRPLLLPLIEYIAKSRTSEHGFDCTREILLCFHVALGEDPEHCLCETLCAPWKRFERPLLQLAFEVVREWRRATVEREECVEEVRNTHRRLQPKADRTLIPSDGLHRSVQRVHVPAELTSNERIAVLHGNTPLR